MKYMPQVKVSKEDFLALSDLAGDMSIMDYMSKVIHEHVAAQQSVQADGACTCYKPLLTFNGVTSTTCIRCGGTPRS